MSFGVHSYLLVSAIIFSIGIFGFFLNRRHIIHLLISIELILLAVNINFVAFSADISDLAGQVFCVFVLDALVHTTTRLKKSANNCVY